MHSSYTLILCVVSISHYTQPLFLITVLLLHQVTYQTVFSHCNQSFISLICDHSVIIKLIIHLCILHSSVLRPSTLSSTIHPHGPLLRVLGPLFHTSHTPLQLFTHVPSPSSYFLLQRCWQFVAMERPTFAEIINDLKDLAIKPTRHIILKSSRDESTPGYVSENGQVFIRAVPVEGQNTNRLSQISGTYQSMISSLDDTICSKETADTLVYMHSEIETEDYSDAGLDEEVRADWVDKEGSGRHVGVPNGMRVLRGGRDESEENGSSDGASSNGARSTQTDSDRQATSDQSESEDESCDGSQDRLASLWSTLYP